MIARIFAAALILTLSAASAHAVFQQGVDVYSGQGSVNWATMKSGGISFAFVKATEGQSFIDSQFTTNMANAKTAGVLVGPYHFALPNSFNTDADANNEAHDFVAAITPYYAGTNLTLRPVLDFETLAGVSNEATYLSLWARTFATYVHNNLGMDVIIYTDRDFAQHYLAADLAQYPLWIAKPISTTASAATQNDFSQASPPVNSELGIWSTNGYKFWQWSWGAEMSAARTQSIATRLTARCSSCPRTSPISTRAISTITASSMIATTCGGGRLSA